MRLQTASDQRRLRDSVLAAVWLLCAPLAYFVCAFVLSTPQAGALLSAATPAQLVWMLPLARYSLPVLCLLVGLRYALAALASLGSNESIRSSDEAEWMRSLAWLQFEQLVEGHFTHRGLRTVVLQGQAPWPARLSAIDGQGRMTLVHYSEWKTTEVGFDVVKSLADELAARGAQSGVLMSFGRLTRSATTFAADNNIEVISGERLTRILRSSGWDSSRFRESSSGASTGFGNNPP